MKRITLLFVLILSLLASAQGATLTYNTGLTDPPGTYFGSGNTNTGWTVSQDNDGLELGLRAHLRFIGDATSVGNEYYVPTGATTVPTKTGSAWGFAFSVNTNYDGSSSNEVDDYSYLLSITNLNTLDSISFDPSLIPDNALNGTTGFQNAESLHFAFLGIPLNYDINAAHTYRIGLSAIPKSITSAIVSPQEFYIDVNVGQEPVPEPGTYVMMGAGLLALTAIRRRKA